MYQACIRFEQHLKRRFGQSSTLKHDSSDLSIFLQFRGDKAPEAVMPADIGGFIDQQIAIGMRATQVRCSASSTGANDGSRCSPARLTQ